MLSCTLNIGSVVFSSEEAEQSQISWVFFRFFCIDSSHPDSFSLRCILNESVLPKEWKMILVPMDCPCFPSVVLSSSPLHIPAYIVLCMFVTYFNATTWDFMPKFFFEDWTLTQNARKDTVKKKHPQNILKAGKCQREMSIFRGKPWKCLLQTGSLLSATSKGESPSCV